jgi:hypothetical protein
MHQMLALKTERSSRLQSITAVWNAIHEWPRRRWLSDLKGSFWSGIAHRFTLTVLQIACL